MLGASESKRPGSGGGGGKARGGGHEGQPKGD